MVGENPVDTYPNRKQVEAPLGKWDFLVVQDMFMTSTAKMAHVAVPSVPYEKSASKRWNAESRKLIRVRNRLLGRPI